MDDFGNKAKQLLDDLTQMGQALAEIRDTGLYREETPTFEEFCLRRWGLSKEQVERIIAAARKAGPTLPGQN